MQIYNFFPTCFIIKQKKMSRRKKKCIFAVDFLRALMQRFAHKILVFILPTHLDSHAGFACIDCGTQSFCKKNNNTALPLIGCGDFFSLRNNLIV